MALVPEFNFQPFITPVRRLPLEQLNTTLGELQTRFETASNNLTEYERANAALESAPTAADQEYMAGIKDEFNRRFQDISGREDLENALFDTQRLNSNFNAKAIPILQRKEQFNEQVKNIRESGAIKNKGAAQQALQGYFGQTLEFDEAGNPINRYNPNDLTFLGIEEVDPQANLDKFTSNIIADIHSWAPRMVDVKDAPELIKAIRQGKVKEIDEKRLNAIIDNAIMGDQGIQNLIAKDDAYEELTGERLLGSEQQIEAAREAIYNKLDYKQTDLRYSTLDLTPKGDGGGKKTPAQISNTYAWPDGLSTQPVYTSPTDLNNAIGQLEKQKNDAAEGKAIPLTVLEETNLQRYQATKAIADRRTAEVLKGTDFTDEERATLAESAQYTDDEIAKELASANLVIANSKGLRPDDPGLVAARNKNLKFSAFKNVRDRVDENTTKELQDIYQVPSFTPEVIVMNDAKVETGDKTYFGEVKRKVQNDWKNYEWVDQHGVPIEEIIANMTEAEKEKIPEISDSKSFIESVTPELSINGMTKFPIHKGSQAYTGNLSTKYSSIFGKQVYIVPKMGMRRSGELNRAYEAGAINPDQPENIMLTNVNKLSKVVPEPEMQAAMEYFQGMMQWTPQQLQENSKINGRTTSEVVTPIRGLPSIEYMSNGNVIEYVFKNPDGTRSEPRQAVDFIQITEDYFNQ